MMVKIRTATSKDWFVILRLIKQNPSTLLQKHLPQKKDFIVAVIDGKIVGCCALEIYSKRLAEIRSLVVDKKFRGLGIASGLIATCIAKAKKKKVYEVLSITGAEKLFEKQGFGTFKNEKYALLKVLGT